MWEELNCAYTRFKMEDIFLNIRQDRRQVYANFVAHARIEVDDNVNRGALWANGGPLSDIEFPRMRSMFVLVGGRRVLGEMLPAMKCPKISSMRFWDVSSRSGEGRAEVWGAIFHELPVSFGIAS
jgi:hypothetical protein